jgi:hypothetical protein
MESERFDRIVRLFARGGSRRRLLAAAGALLALPSRRVWAAQAPASCAATGDVCTMLLGCCSGLTCATSAINPSYGVCVPGEGGMVTTGTSLVLPFAEDDAEAAQAVVDAAASSTDPTAAAELEAERDAQEAERETRIAEKKAQKEAQKLEKQTRLAERRDRRADSRFDRRQRRGPRIELAVACNASPQFVTIRNHSNDTVNVAKIGSLLNPVDPHEPHTPTDLPIESETTIQLQFGGLPGDIASAVYITNFEIFDDSPLEGVRLELTTGHVRVTCCERNRCKSPDSTNSRRKSRREKRRKQELRDNDE